MDTYEFNTFSCNIQELRREPHTNAKAERKLGRLGGIGVENNTENLPLILLSRGAAETLERREARANGEGAGCPREASASSHGRYFRRWMHLSQAMERITGRQRIVEHDFRLPRQEQASAQNLRHPTQRRSEKEMFSPCPC